MHPPSRIEPLPLKNQQDDELLNLNVGLFPEFMRFANHTKTRKVKRQTAIIPHENDVLMGRGGRNNQHEGNEKLREFARRVKDAYQRASKREKSNLSRELVRQVRSLNPPGRFLKRQSISNEWADVGDKVAREKASQVLRDACASNMTPSTSSTNSESGDISENLDYSPVPIPHCHSMPTPAPTTPPPHNLYLPQHPYSAPCYSAFLPAHPPAYQLQVPPPNVHICPCPEPMLSFHATAYSSQTPVHLPRKRKRCCQPMQECTGDFVTTEMQLPLTGKRVFNHPQAPQPRLVSQSSDQYSYDCDNSTNLSKKLYQEELPDSETEYERFQSEYNPRGLGHV